MSKDVGMIGVEQVEEHEDGSATYQFHLDKDCAKLLQEEGLKLVLYCAAAKLDIQVVYDFITDHIKYEADDLTEYKFGTEDHKKEQYDDSSSKQQG